MVTMGIDRTLAAVTLTRLAVEIRPPADGGKTYFEHAYEIPNDTRLIARLPATMPLDRIERGPGVASDRRQRLAGDAADRCAGVPRRADPRRSLRADRHHLQRELHVRSCAPRAQRPPGRRARRRRDLRSATSPAAHPTRSSSAATARAGEAPERGRRCRDDGSTRALSTARRRSRTARAPPLDATVACDAGDPLCSARRPRVRRPARRARSLLQRQVCRRCRRAASG